MKVIMAMAALAQFSNNLNIQGFLLAMYSIVWLSEDL